MKLSRNHPEVLPGNPRLASPLSLSILSWNVHATPLSLRKGDRLARVVTKILEQRPDVVLLQELWTFEDARQLIRKLGKTYSAAGVQPRGMLIRKSGLLTLLRRQSGWSIQQASFHEFEAEASDWIFWEADGLGGKGIHRIDIERKGARVVILNTHLQSEYGKTKYKEVRTRQLQELRSMAEGVPLRFAVIAAGDLNTSPDEDLYTRLVAYWHDLGATERATCGCGTYLLDGGAEEAWIDYILARREDEWRATVREFELVVNERPDRPYSDHHGLLVRLELWKRTSTRPVALGLLLSQTGKPLTRRQWLLAAGLDLAAATAQWGHVGGEL